MKSSDDSTSGRPGATQSPSIASTQMTSSSGDISKNFKMPASPIYDGSRRRSSSLEITDFPSRPLLRRTSSSGWLQSFTRRASIDFTDIPLSPAGSVENLASSDGSEPRSRNNSGDVIPTISEHGAGLVDTQTSLNGRTDRRKSDPTAHTWKWKLFSVPQDDDLRRRKISEAEEGVPDAQSMSVNKNMTSQTNVPSFSILGYARKMSARDLNALSPSGDM